MGSVPRLPPHANIIVNTKLFPIPYIILAYYILYSLVYRNVLKYKCLYFF